MKRIITYTLFLLLSIQFSGFAQISILEAYKEEGVDRNKEFLSHQMLHHAFLEKEMQFSRLSDLQLSAGFALSPIETRLGAQTMQFGATQRFPWFGTLKAKLSLFEAENEVHNELLRLMGSNLVHRIEKSWFQLYEIRLNKVVLSEKIQLIKMIESLTREQIKTNSDFSLIDLIEIQINREAWENNLADLIDAEEMNQYAFNTLLSKDLNSNVKTVDSLLELLNFSPNTEGQVIAINRQNLKVRAAEESISLIKRTTKPSWTVGFKYFIVDERPTDLVDNGKDAYMFNIGLNIPFQLKQNEHAVMEATHKWHSEGITLEQVKEEYDFILAKIELAIKKQNRDFNLHSSQKVKVDQTISLLLKEYAHGKGVYEKLLRAMELSLDQERKRISAVVQQRIQISYYHSLFEMDK